MTDKQPKMPEGPNDAVADRPAGRRFDTGANPDSPSRSVTGAPAAQARRGGAAHRRGAGQPAVRLEAVTDGSPAGQARAIPVRGRQPAPAQLAAMRARAAQNTANSPTGPADRAQQVVTEQPRQNRVEVMRPAVAVPLPVDMEVKRYADMLVVQRRHRARRTLRRLGLFILLPTVLVFLYTFFLATPRYVSTVQLTYQLYQPQQTLSTGGLLTNMFSSQGGTVDYGVLTYEYIRSGEMLAKLDAKLHLRDYYSSNKIDWPSRLSRGASDETFLEYYNQRIVSVTQELGGYLTVDVTAFDGDYAEAVAKAVVQATDEMIDRMAERARNDEVRFAEEELSRQQEREKRALSAVTLFQNSHGLLSPQSSATQLQQIAGGLETSLATARAQLLDAQAHLSPVAPQIDQLKSKIKALEEQILAQQHRLANSNDATPYSKILEEYTLLQLEEQFASSAVQSAQQGLAVARADAARKQNYMVDFVAPGHPTHPTKWTTIDYTVTTFFAALVLYAVLSLTAGALRDQAGM
jgi:capsular polysaccharide transport system permease protein